MKRLLAIVLIALVALPALAAQENSKLKPQIQDANWIWLKGFEETPNATVYLRKTFTLPAAPQAGVIEITCDNAYKVWINGQFAAETLNPGPESWRVADRYDISTLVRAGENYVVVQGVNASGQAGLLAQILIEDADGSITTINTDASWEAASEPGDNWQQAADSGGAWQPALDYGRAATTPPWFYPRPPSNLMQQIGAASVSLLQRVVSPTAVKIDPQTTARMSGMDASATGWTSFSRISIDPEAEDQRVVLVCDFGKEVVGHPMLIGNAYAPLSVTVAAGEFEAECDKPYQPATSGVIDRGAIRWMAPDRRAFRYVKFVIEPRGRMSIDRIQAQLLEYPVSSFGSFECSDDMLNRIWDTSRHTLFLCMQDYYEDGVKRDRLLWTGDLRVEALTGYYAYGLTGLARRGLMQLADIQLPDGLIPAVGPAASSTYLPDYCAYWVMSLADYYRQSGDVQAVELLYPHLQKVMDWFKNNSDETGLFRNADRPGWWIFIDWDDSMEKKDRVMALEALYLWALRDAAELSQAIYKKADYKTYTDRAKQLRAAINTTLWSEGQSAYVDCATDEGPSTKVHKQPNALALLAGVPESEQAANVVETLLNPEVPAVTTPYMNFYVASALMENGRKAEALALIRDYWGAMIDRGATTFWEKFDPNWPTPYEQADLSYCHGWSSGPGYLLPAYIAGVRPTKPGYSQAVVEPELAGLEWAKAQISTPLGRIKVDWKAVRECPTGTVDVPRGITAMLRLPQPPEGYGYTLNGRLAKFRQDKGKLLMALKGGDVYEFGLAETGKR